MAMRHMAMRRTGTLRAPRLHATRPALVLRLLIAALLALQTSVGIAGADTAGDLVRAEGLFETGEFEAALDTLDGIIAETDITEAQLRDAHALKARCEAELGNPTNAINAFCQVIVMDPEWRPDPVYYTAREIALFEEATRRCEPEGQRSWLKNPLTWAAGGAVAALVAVLAASGGDNGGDGGTDGGAELPDFPPPPTN